VEDAVATIERLLEEIQTNLFLKAKAFREENTRKANTWEEFVNILENEGGFISAHWDGTPETEEKIKELTKATIRCIPFDAEEEEGKCILTGKPSHRRVIFAKAY
jgi:prolyl-tRNA synthetase